MYLTIISNSHKQLPVEIKISNFSGARYRFDLDIYFLVKLTNRCFFFDKNNIYYNTIGKCMYVYVIYGNAYLKPYCPHILHIIVVYLHLRPYPCNIRDNEAR